MKGSLRIREGLAVVQTPAGKTALISGNSLGFEVDGVAREILSLCDGRSGDRVVEALSVRYPEEDVREALGELRSLGAIEVGSLRRFLVPLCRVASFLKNGLPSRWLQRSVRVHGDQVLDRLAGDPPRSILLYTFSDHAAATKVPAALLRERFPTAALRIWHGSRERARISDTREFRECDLSVGVYDTMGSHPVRRSLRAWRFGRSAGARRHIAYLDRHDFLGGIAIPFLLSVLHDAKVRLSEASRSAGLRGYAFCAGLLRVPQPGSAAPRRILVLSPGGLGDVAMTTPALRALRRGYPDAHVVCMVPPEAAGLLAACPFIDEIYPSPIRGRGGFRDFARQIRAAREIRRRRFDMAVTLRHWPGQACDGYLPYMAAIPRRLGPVMPDGRMPGRIFTHPVRTTSRHQSDSPLEVVGVGGGDRNLHLCATEADRQFVDAYLESEGIGVGEPIVGIHPGSSAEVKQWPADRFARLADLLRMRWGVKVVVTGGPADVKLGWEVASHMATAPVITAGNLTLAQTLAAIDRCDLFLCADSGPMHLASALGTPLVALFGATDPATWGPRSADSRVVRSDVACGPRPACCAGPRPSCPRGTGVCMTAISVEEVLRGAEELLTIRIPALHPGEGGEAR